LEYNKIIAQILGLKIIVEHNLRPFIINQ